MSSKTFEILLVEDDPADVSLMTHCLEECALDVNLTVVEDGQAALDLLSPKGDQPAYHPNLVLLDLNLPILGGFDVLKAIRSDARLKDVPVFIVSTSVLEEDIERAHGLAADRYISKPLEYGGYAEIGTQIETYLSGAES